MLVRRELLERIGGLSAIRDAVIDDVALAKACKKAGGRLWLGYHPGVQSTRSYHSLGAIWNMVARSAYTQLGYNPVLLAVCVVALFVVFVWPALALLVGPPELRPWSLVTYLAMTRTYAPLVTYLRCSRVWSFALPVASLLYLGMTISSAWRYYRGTRTEWKGREYRSS